MLKVLQLNVGSLFEPDWSARRDRIVQVIDTHKPDVACFQEVWWSETKAPTVAWIADQAAGEWHLAVGGGVLPTRHSPEPGATFGSAIMSRWPIERERLLQLPAASGSREPTGVPLELLYVRTAGLDVFSTHLAAAPTQSDHRQVQVLGIDDLISEIRAGVDTFDSHGDRRQGMPPILCGDFNAEPESDEIRFLSGLTRLQGRSTYFQDAWRVAGDPSDPGYTQDWRTNPLAADLNVPRKRIDYVFVGDAFRRAGNAGRVLSAEVVPALDELGDGPAAAPLSDHEAIVVEIEWPQRPADSN